MNTSGYLLLILRSDARGCQDGMHYIGPRMEVPPALDVKGWQLFYDYITKPLPVHPFASILELDPARAEENEHWRVCKLRMRKKVHGCKRCEAVERRLPEETKLTRDLNCAFY